jgi:two-component system phosphate regulon sensor histidine kinase PhoR
MKRQVWIRELLLVGAGLGLTGLFSVLWGHWVYWSLGLCLCLLVRLYRQMDRWLVWLDHPDLEIPEGWGIWREVAHAVRWRVRSMRINRNGVEQRYPELIRHLSPWSEGVLLLDYQGRLVSFNENAAALLGLRIPQDYGQFIGNFLRYPAFLSLFETPRPAGTVDLPSPVDENVTLQIAVSGLDEGVLMWVRDATAQKREEQRGFDFLVNASHELRTPLTVLSGYLEVLLEDPEQEAESRKVLLDMQRETERMKRLVTGFLELVRLNPVERHGFGELVRMQSLIPLLKRRVNSLGLIDREVEFRIQEQPAVLKGSEAELLSAFWNLIENAIKFVGPKGQVVVTWESTEAGGGCFSVRDDGQGIPAHLHKRITERFYRIVSLKEEGPAGFGLGLAIVRQILDRHGARLVVDSTPGEGSQFSCVFPPVRVAVEPLGLEGLPHGAADSSSVVSGGG